MFFLNKTVILSGPPDKVLESDSYYEVFSLKWQKRKASEGVEELMELWYRILEILPFEWAREGQMIFMKNALLAVILLTPIFALLGTMIVNNNMAFFLSECPGTWSLYQKGL